ncbi:MAG: hydrogenase maturation nickel metallochaperone HypA [candidate division NC10 bacterium]|nr:hydrogenase maturation nickel metallochaperone HypA [candidate division NC10 bacterium]
MHELSIAKSILDIALRRAQEGGFQRIRSIHVQVGRLSGIEPESLRFCFGVLSADTLAQSAALEVEILSLRGRCRVCGGEFDLPEIDLVCPACHHGDLEVISGTEMVMDRMEVE